MQPPPLNSHSDTSPHFAAITERLLIGHSSTQTEWQQLIDWTLEDRKRAIAFGITPENASSFVHDQVRLLQVSWPRLQEFCKARFRGAIPIETLWNLWLPLALRLGNQRQANGQPFIQGILGGQGSGKTTLGAVLTLLLQHLGYRTFSLSLDDLYKTHADRLKLREADPRLIWRGPPGTHDVELGLQVLDQLRHPSPGRPVAIPHFDKSLHNGSGDRTTPELVSDIDIVLFEGWFIGVRPVNPGCFDTAPRPIVTDADRAFARDTNDRLQAYLPLWQRLDSLIVLYPVDYRYSKQWRKQAEQEMRNRGNTGMTDREIDAFVDYFWKALHPELFIQPLITQSGAADLVVEININHLPGAVYRSGD